ncbi:MAG: DinB family protein [Bacteroidota bacterium]
MNRIAGLLVLALFSLQACQPEVKEEQEIELGFADDFSEAWERSKIYTLALADSMPAELYSYKPSEDVFTFSKQLTHTIDFAGGQLMGQGLIEKSPFSGRKWEVYTKAQVIESLTELYDFVDSVVKVIPDAELAKTINFMGQEVPAFRVFQAIENHTIHHRGQALIYMRMNGITPPGYAGW